MREWLKKLRLSNNLTQEQVATKSFIERSYYTQIENRKRNPSLDVAKNIAKVLKFDPMYFFEKNDEDDILFLNNKPINQSILDFLKDKRNLKLLYSYDNNDDYYFQILHFLHAAISVKKYCLIFDSDENYLKYKRMMKIFQNIGTDLDFIRFVDVTNIYSAESLCKNIDETVSSINHPAIFAWIHKEQVNQYTLGKLLQNTRILTNKAVYVQAYNAWNVSAGNHTQLMKEYPLLLIDSQIMASPFYNSSIVPPSLYFQ